MKGLVRVPMQSKKWPPGSKAKAGVILSAYYTISLHGCIHQVYLVLDASGNIRKLQGYRLNGG